MKITRTSTLLTLAIAGPASADVIYSNLQDIAIPKNNDGVYLNVLTGSTSTTGWHINPTFGGINVYNSADFQPLREANSNLGTLSNISVGGLIEDTSTHFATGFGASGDHLGTGKPFAAGTEGYIGFSVVDGIDTNYGWMRVVFTGTGTPLIKDWAYDTGGGSIVAGNVLQSGSTYTLDSSTQSFALGSTITGSNSVMKIGANTVTLNVANNYSGTTDIDVGTLALGASGSIGGSSVITVASGATLDVSAVTGGWTLGASQTLTGSGGVTGNATIAGTHNAGTSGVGSQAFTGDLTYASGSTFAWDLTESDTNTGFDTVSASGTLTAESDSVFKVVLGGNALAEIQDTNNAFWNTPFGTQNWAMTGIFGSNFSGSFSSVTSDFDVTPYGSFSIDGSNLTWTAIPEPSAALAGLLLTAGLLRRRRVETARA